MHKPDCFEAQGKPVSSKARQRAADAQRKLHELMQATIDAEQRLDATWSEERALDGELPPDDGDEDAADYDGESVDSDNPDVQGLGHSSYDRTQQQQREDIKRSNSLKRHHA